MKKLYPLHRTLVPDDTDFALKIVKKYIVFGVIKMQIFLWIK